MSEQPNHDDASPLVNSGEQSCEGAAELAVSTGSQEKAGGANPVTSQVSTETGGSERDRWRRAQARKRIRDRDAGLVEIRLLVDPRHAVTVREFAAQLSDGDRCSATGDASSLTWRERLRLTPGPHQSAPPTRARGMARLAAPENTSR